MGREPAAGSGVIVRRLLQHDTIASRRALLRGHRLSQCARARRMRRPGRERRELRRFVALKRSDLGDHHHAQTGERRARQALVRAGAGFTMTVARRRSSPATAVSLSPQSDLTTGVSMGRARFRRSQRPSCSARRRRTVLIYVHGFKHTFEMAALDAAHLSDGIKFRGRTMVFSWFPRRDFSTTHMIAKARCGRATISTRAQFYRRDAGPRAEPHRGAQHGNHADSGKPAPALCAIWRRRPDRIGSVVFAAPTSTWMCSPRPSAASVRSPARSPSLPRRTIARWRCQGGSRRDETGRRRREGRHRATRGARDRCVRRRLGLFNHDLFLSNAEVLRAIRRSIILRRRELL